MEKELIECDQDELKKVDEDPLMKTLEKNRKKGKSNIVNILFSVRDDGKYDRNDIVQCKICGNKFLRHSTSTHQKSKYHKKFAKINNTMRKFILNNKIESDSDEEF